MTIKKFLRYFKRDHLELDSKVKLKISIKIKFKEEMQS